jgi:hypothetical protein
MGYHKLTLHILIFIQLLATGMYAATLKGHIFDSKTKEALIGAIIYNKDDKKNHDAAGLDGSYSIKNLNPGTYTLVSEYIGYVKQERTIIIKDANEVQNQDFLLEIESVKLGETLIIASQDKGSDYYARDLEKNSDNLINVLSAKSISLMPDITIGNILQRVSGVTVQTNSNGEGKYATIRGMDKRYNYTTIDGIKIPSPDPDARYVPMDIFPAEMVERLDVIKSLTPNMEGDATGGVVNLVLKDAPDHFIFDANALTGYNQTLFNQSFETFNTNSVNSKSPSEQYGPAYQATNSNFPLGDYEYKKIQPLPDILAGFTIGNRFLNHKLGVTVSGTYQDTYSGSSSFFLNQDVVPNANGSPEFKDIEYRTYSLEQQRMALHAKLDYEFNQKHKISFYSVLVGLDATRQRHFSDTTGTSSKSNASQYDVHDETKVVNQSIFSSSLRGDDSLYHNLKLDWTAAYSLAGSNTPDWGDLVSTGASGSPIQYWDSFTRRWLSSTDQDISEYVNLTYKLKLAPRWYDKIFGRDGIELRAGEMNRNKSRENQYYKYDFAFSPMEVNNGIQNAQFTLQNPAGNPQNSLNYAFQENVYAVYGQGKFIIGDKLQILGGLRMENTSQNYNINELVSIAYQNGSIQYYDLLPSYQLKYIINEKQAIRGSYYRSITRPSYYELVPYTIKGEYYDEQGNPFVNHSQVNNYDLRYEFFPKPSEQILAGVFYKNIFNPIELAFQPEADAPSTAILTPGNFGNATNYGFEFVYLKYFGHFGISANYTYTQSQITTSKVLFFIDAATPTEPDKTKLVDQTRPMQGQAAHVANLSLIYKNPKIGLDAQISIGYIGKLISVVSLDYDLDQWQMPMTKIDFSFEKKLSKKMNLSIYGKVNNILNTALVFRMMQPNIYINGSYAYPEQNSSNSILVEKELYGQSYLMGIKYKF